MTILNTNRAMQTTEATAPILPVISQVEFDRLAALQIKLEIIAILAALKNGKTCRRFLAKILKGATHNDCEFIPIILWHMFGATADGAPAMHPECLYPGNHREMSMNRLQVLLDAQYQISPSYDQLRRVFVALKKHGLLSNHLYRTQDANGKWTTESGYTFNTERWQALLKETAKAPKFKKGKKGKKATETKTGVRKKSSRVRSSETSEKPSIFSAAPCGASGTISSDNRERPDSSPGSSSVVSVSSSTVQQGELSATQQKTPATPSVEVCDFLSQKDQSARIKAKQEKDGPRYVENPNAPDFEVFLAEVLEHRATAGEGVPENWREALYTTEGSEDGLTLKPRIPDCTVLTPDDQSTTCGIWVHDGAFIRCSPADIELSKTVASHLGCPLRAQDWPRFLRQTHRPASDPLRLTAESFQEVVSALPGTGSDLNVNIEG
ncbi:MAG: hypothetical protein EBY17_30205, partial [Acidobacteriia bacterium]|nr:hypothetical protein [Terriglobia bacterium]